MIEWTSTPYLLGPISSHGTFMAIGVVVAALLGRRDAKRTGLNLETFDTLVLLAILGGVLGARLLYLALHFGDYQNSWEILKIWKGGLSSFGGLIGGIVTSMIYLKWKKESWLKYADALGPHILLGWGIGRIGDLILWSEFGTPTQLPWGFVVGGDVPRHPTQIYELIDLTLLWGLLLCFRRRLVRQGIGVLFAVSMLLYFGQRFFLEFIRDYPGETSVINYRFFAQGISLFFILLFTWQLKKILRTSR